LPLAVTLAGTAFEAYLTPTGAEGCQEVSFNGTETTYTDKAFLASAFAGILQASTLPAVATHTHRPPTTTRRPPAQLHTQQPHQPAPAPPIASATSSACPHPHPSLR
jgi:hypothetical protein